MMTKGYGAVHTVPLFYADGVVKCDLIVYISPYLEIVSLKQQYILREYSLNVLTFPLIYDNI